MQYFFSYSPKEYLCRVSVERFELPKNFLVPNQEPYQIWPYGDNIYFLKRTFRKTTVKESNFLNRGCSSTPVHQDYGR